MDKPPSDQSSGSFWHELKRRKVFRVATAYALAVFVLLQILDATADALGMTRPVVQILLAIMVAGFPVTVTLAWFLEITPQGLIAERSSRLVRRFGRSLEIALLTGLFLVTGIAAFFIVASALRVNDDAAVRIAVLAFENYTGDPDNGYISQGLADELIDGLTGIEQLVVLPRTASFYYQNKDVDFRTIAAALDADMLLEGSLLDRQNGRLRVTAQLVDARGGGHVWSEIYDRKLGSLIEVKQDIARQVVRALELTLAPEDAASVESPPTTSGEAYDLYLQGKDYLQRATSRDEREVARDLFARAFELDSNFTDALAGQCRTEIQLYATSTTPADHRRALATCTRVATLAEQSPETRLALAELARSAGDCQRALEIYRGVIEAAPTLEPAYYGLARCHETLGDPAAAETAYRRSVELERRNWQVYLGYSGFLYRRGRYLESAAMSRRIIELTPDNGLAWSNLGTALYAADRWAEAGEAWRRGHELEPNQFSYVNLATALYYQHRFDEARSVLEEAARAFPDNYRVWGKLGATCRNLPGSADRMSEAYHRAVELAEAAVAVNPDNVAVLGPLGTYYANLGRFEQAEQTLTRAVELAPADPELRYFQALVQRLQSRDDRARALLARALELGYSHRLMAQEPLMERLAYELAADSTGTP